MDAGEAGTWELSPSLRYYQLDPISPAVEWPMLLLFYCSCSRARALVSSAVFSGTIQYIQYG